MKSLVKYGIVPVVTFCFLVVITMVLLPVVLNVQQYTPRIEKQISEIIERPFSLGSDLTLTFFPWLSVSCSEVKLGNQPGFRSDELLRVASFEARLKILPLLRGRLEFSRFIVGGLKVNLEKSSGGSVNWTNGNHASNMSKGGNLPSVAQSFGFIDQADLFVITDGTIIWNDRSQNTHHQLSEVMVVLHDFAPEKKVRGELQFSFDGIHLQGEGSVGPLQGKIMDGTLPCSYSFLAGKHFKGKIEGIMQTGPHPLVKAHLVTEDFDPKLFLPDSLKTNEPDRIVAGRKASMDMDLLLEKGTLAISSGSGMLDDSKIDFTLKKNFENHQTSFTCAFDQIDLLPYLMLWNDSVRNSTPVVQSVPGTTRAEEKGTLEGLVHISEAKIGRLLLSDLNWPVMINQGNVVISPVDADLYGGKLNGEITSSITGAESVAEFRFSGVASKQMLGDMAGWQFLSGSLQGTSRLELKRTNENTFLSGMKADAELAFKEGTINGILIDAGEVGDEANTQFKELALSLTVEEGLLSIEDGSLQSENGRSVLGGVANLAEGDLDFLLTPLGETGASDGQVTIALRGKLTDPSWDKVIAGAAVSNNATQEGSIVQRKNSKDITKLVDQQLPTPPEAQKKGLVGKTLIDPEVVVRRIGLQPMEISAGSLVQNPPPVQHRIEIQPLKTEQQFH